MIERDGAVVRRWREENGIRRKQLAKALGLSYRFIIAVELGERAISDRKLPLFPLGLRRLLVEQRIERLRALVAETKTGGPHHASPPGPSSSFHRPPA